MRKTESEAEPIEEGMTHEEYARLSLRMRRLPLQLEMARAKYQMYIDRAVQLGMKDILTDDERKLLNP